MYQRLPKKLPNFAEHPLLAAVFVSVKSIPECPQVHISCAEIYNEAAYDLLAATRSSVRSLEDLQRVHLLEDSESQIHLRNLSVHRAATEEEALNLVPPPLKICIDSLHCLKVSRQLCSYHTKGIKVLLTVRMGVFLYAQQRRQHTEYENCVVGVHELDRCCLYSHTLMIARS